MKESLILRLTFILLFVLTLQLRGKFEKRDFATTPQIIFLCADDFLRQLLMVRGRTETPMILNRILHPVGLLVFRLFLVSRSSLYPLLNSSLLHAPPSYALQTVNRLFRPFLKETAYFVLKTLF